MSSLTVSAFQVSCQFLRFIHIYYVITHDRSFVTSTLTKRKRNYFNHKGRVLLAHGTVKRADIKLTRDIRRMLVQLRGLPIRAR